MYVYLASIAGNGLCEWRTKKKKEVFTFDHDGAGTGKPTTSVSFLLLFPCVCFIIHSYITR